MKKKRYDLQWHVGHSKAEDEIPEKNIPATVPGAVQLDWAKSEGWEDYTISNNYQKYSWMEDVYWVYSTVLEPPNRVEGERLFFVCQGVDYKFILKLNHEVLYEQEGMFTPFEIDLTERASACDQLQIVIFPAPKRPGAPVGRSEADQSCKPAVSYGWDWHPRLIPLGIWEETYLEVRPSCHIGDCETFYTMQEECKSADITVRVELVNPSDGWVHWQLFDPKENTVFEYRTATSSIVEFAAKLENPALWWPNGHGEPALYRSLVKLFDSQGAIVEQCESKVGFRSVKLVMHPGAWDKPSDFPKTRSNPPITLEINGRAIFCKGSNWVNPSIFPGIITEDTYRPLLTLAKDAHMNLLRSWGGGIINKESFFRLCDEMGLMVWQEFPLACNNYEGTPDYLLILDQESRSILKRLRSHACVVIWCGGNELFNAWSGMTDQSLALRLLNRNCYELDPQTPFIMTSPLMGMGHGHYLFRDENDHEVYQTMPKASNTAYTEFGCPGPSSAEYLRRFIPEEELFPPSPNTAWETHHAFNAWRPSDWLNLDTLETYFGESRTLEKLVERGQLLQSEGYKCIFEEARRQKPVCSMALNWCYNEPWPTAVNNSLINWPAIPKPSYWAVQSSCRPILASARIPKFLWTAGEWFQPELWMLSDSPAAITAGVVQAYLLFEDEERFMLTWEYPELLPNVNQPGPTLRYLLPLKKSGMMKLLLKVKGFPEWNSEYHLVYKRPDNEDSHQVKMLNI